MNRTNFTLKLLITTLLSVIPAAFSGFLLLNVLGMQTSLSYIGMGALVGGLLCLVMSLGKAALLCTGGLSLLGIAAVFVLLPDAYAGLVQSVASLKDSAVLATASPLFSALAGLLLVFILYPMTWHRSAAPFALCVELSLLIIGYGFCPELSLMYAVPSLVCAVALFAWAGPVSRDMIGGWRALIPAVLAVCIAFFIIPSQGTTYAPLEKAASRVKHVFEDYFNFTAERVPFTLYAQGYDHAEEVGGSAAVVLGGPANPNPENALAVTADHDVLLRGSIYRTYNGLAWRDVGRKTRYLYYDFTRRSTREALYNMHDNENMTPVTAHVEFLRDGCSALFIPTRTQSIEMSGETAVYYNSIGETFLAREVVAGDSYNVSGYTVPSREKARAAVLAAAGRDGDYKSILKANSYLPSSLEEDLKTLTMQIVEGHTSPFDKAAAIEDWLIENCVYTLSPAMPAQGRDFVSEFVLDTREGYCSYFASAMTVMCRLAGLPARYAEGYAVPASVNGEPVILTGEDAHAWTEVYFSGFGWMPFDPAAGTDGYASSHQTSDDAQTPPEGGSSESGLNGDVDYSPKDTPAAPDENNGGQPTPTPTPESSSGNDSAENTPTPNPDDGAANSPENTPTPNPDTAQAPTPTPPTPPLGSHDQDDHPDIPWKVLAALLALLLLALLVFLLWRRMRLRKTDAIALAGRAKDTDAVYIFYRAILTLLAQMGQMPMDGETPSKFAKRVSTLLNVPEYADFVAGVTMSTYSNKPMDENTCAAGRVAYEKFFAAMKPQERKRFNRVRILHGLGNFDRIP